MDRRSRRSSNDRAAATDRAHRPSQLADKISGARPIVPALDRAIVLARKNLSRSPFVRTVDMGWLSANVTDRATSGARTQTAEAERRDRFLGAARPTLDRAYRMAGLLLANAHEAEDAVQDALAVAWQSFDSLRDPSKFGGWFDRIVVNNCRDRLRRRGTVRFIPLALDVDPAGRDPFQAFLERDAILAGLDRLTPDERIVVVLRFWADLPLEAIADRLDWPLGTVKSRLHRALGRLRTTLDREGTEAGR
jgi:RNA polymerase sigma factor (sigma-70 family)